MLCESIPGYDDWALSNDDPFAIDPETLALELLIEDQSNVITREQAIDYINQLGDPIDWEGCTLAAIRAEVLKGDEYDGMNIWENMLIDLGVTDIQTNQENG